MATDIEQIIPRLSDHSQLNKSANIGGLAWVRRRMIGDDSIRPLGDLRVFSGDNEWRPWPGLTEVTYEEAVEMLRGMWAAQDRWSAYLRAGMA